jgi:hypothetical protein
MLLQYSSSSSSSYYYYYFILLQFDVNFPSDKCAANSTRFNNANTPVVPYSRKTNVLNYNYQLCQAAGTRSNSINGLGVFFDSELFFQNNIYLLFSEFTRILSLIRSTNIRCSSLDYLYYVLHFTLGSFKLEYI